MFRSADKNGLGFEATSCLFAVLGLPCQWTLQRVADLHAPMCLTRKEHELKMGLERFDESF